MTMTAHRPSQEEDGALDYDRLPEPWRQWAKLARSFTRQLDDPWDREDLMHNIIVRLAEVAEEYRLKGRSLSRWGAIRVAQYTRLRFYKDKQRWKRVHCVDLNSAVEDEDGNETELVETIPCTKGIDPDVWLDFKSYFQSWREREKQAVRELVTQGGQNLSGHDWRLIREFREGYKP